MKYGGMTMKISEIYVNHMHHPVGFELKDLRIELSIEAESFRKIQSTQMAAK